MLALLSACGGTNFNGDYDGTITRTTTQNHASVTVVEEWHIEPGELVRTWLGGSCVLELERGTCSMGCYSQVVLGGGTCVFDGQAYVLESGVIDSKQDGDDETFSARFSWALESGAPAALTETGVMVQR